jgi:hypothetical protein
MSTTPDSHPRYWDKTADWVVTQEKVGFSLKNIRFNEYLHAAPDDLALKDDELTVFTKKHYDNLDGYEIWFFSKDVPGNDQFSFELFYLLTSENKVIFLFHF